MEPSAGSLPPPRQGIAIIGAGPAGLAAAERLSEAGALVTVYDRMPSPGRKFLLAGRGGLNLTHSEAPDCFLARYGEGGTPLASALLGYSPDHLRRWAAALGEDTFVGTSGRVFPKSFKSTPLLRAWLRRLDGLGVQFRFRCEWTGWDAKKKLTFRTTDGILSVKPEATLLALGGASWPRLGSDGGWAKILSAEGIAVTPLAPANCGFLVTWSEIFATRFHGAPLKSCRFRIANRDVRSEAVITRTGIEGGAIYGLSASLRAELAAGGTVLDIDLKPDMPVAALAAKLASMRKGETLSNRLRKAAGLSPAAIGLLRECTRGALPAEAAALAAAIKACWIPIAGIAAIDRAISSAGGLSFENLDAGYMLKKRPGVFAAGEMLDWDAPTGGYLLQACFSTGVAAAEGIKAWLDREKT